MLRCLLLVLFALVEPCSPAQMPALLEDVRIRGSGQSREVVLALAGLDIGRKADPSLFDAAARRLQETGLFTSISFTYQPGRKPNSYTLTFSLEDAVQLESVRVDVPGIDQEEFFHYLEKRKYPYSDAIPENAVSRDYYMKLLAAFLEEKGRADEMIAEQQMEPAKGRVVLVFRPANLPKIAAVRFEGCREVSCEELRRAVSKVVHATDYSEIRFRQAVELNVIPIYERRGYLGARLTGVVMLAEAEPEAGVTVVATVAEGERYRIAKLDVLAGGVRTGTRFSSPDCQAGAPVDWSKVEACLEEAKLPWKRRGHASVQAITSRKLNADLTADISASIEPGPQYRFGEIVFLNVGSTVERMLKARWNPPDGIYDEEYLRAFLSEAAKLPELQGVRDLTVEQKQELRPSGVYATDVTIRFRR